MKASRALAAAVLTFVAAGEGASQGPVRRLATVAALREYPSYFHLQNVLLHGELVENGTQIVLRGGERDVPVILNGLTTPTMSMNGPNSRMTSEHAVMDKSVRNIGYPENPSRQTPHGRPPAQQCQASPPVFDRWIVGLSCGRCPH